MIALWQFYGGDFSSWSLTEYNNAPQRILDGIGIMRRMMREVREHRGAAQAVHVAAAQRAKGWEGAG